MKDLDSKVISIKLNCLTMARESKVSLDSGKKYESSSIGLIDH